LSIWRVCKKSPRIDRGAPALSEEVNELKISKAEHVIPALSITKTT
jgi:hypothetical protein